MLIQSCIRDCIFHASAHMLRNNSHPVANHAFLCTTMYNGHSISNGTAEIPVTIHFQCLYRCGFAILKNVIAVPPFVIALPYCHASALPELKCFSNPICDCISIAYENACQSKTVGGTFFCFGVCNILEKLLLN